MREQALADSRDEVAATISAPPLISIGADIDVARLTEEIRAAVQRKKSAGVYPEDLMAELEVTSDGVTLALEGLRMGAAFSTQPPLDSARRVIGGPAAAVKGGLRLALRWYSQWMVSQLSAFASTVIAAATALHDRLQQQSRELKQLQLEVLRDRAWVQMRLDHMDRRLDELMRTGSGDGMTQAPLPRRSTDLRVLGRPQREADGDLERRRASYVEHFKPSRGKVVDLRADDGEFLELLQSVGIQAYGIDTVLESVQRCRDHGLDVRHDDAIAHLTSVSSGSLGGIFAAHLVERLDSASVLRLFQLAADKLAEGGVLILETLNPRSLATRTSAACADLGHIELIHPDVLTFLAKSIGLRDVKVRYSSPPPERNGRMLHSPVEDVAPLVEQLNQRLRDLDDVLFGPTDFAIIARR